MSIGRKIEFAPQPCLKILKEIAFRRILQGQGPSRIRTGLGTITGF